MENRVLILRDDKNISVENVYRTLQVVDNNRPENVLNVSQPFTSLVLVTSGRVKGDQGDPGPAGSFPTTGSYFLDGNISSSFTGSLEGTASYATQALSASWAPGVSGGTTTGSFTGSFTGDHTGSFTGSFYGNGAGLVGIVSSKWTGSGDIWREGNVGITGSLFATYVSSSFTGSLQGTASYAISASWAPGGGEILSYIPIISSKQRGYPGVTIGNTSGWFNSDWAVPYFVGKAHTVISISVNVTNTIALSTIRLALFSDNNLEPGALIEDSGDISSATSGQKTFNFTVPQSLTEQLYWMAYQQSDAATTIRSWATGPLWFKTGGNAPAMGYRRTHPYGEFPPNWPAGAVVEVVTMPMLTLTSQ